MTTRNWTPERVRDLRLSLGLTQKAFAVLIGCTLRNVQRWERVTPDATGRGQRGPSGLYRRALDNLAERVTQEAA
jgi:DNA-binding transcriptional regulator YiaG